MMRVHASKDVTGNVMISTGRAVPRWQNAKEQRLAYRETDWLSGGHQAHDPMRSRWSVEVFAFSFLGNVTMTQNLLWRCLSHAQRLLPPWSLAVDAIGLQRSTL